VDPGFLFANDFELLDANTYIVSNATFVNFHRVYDMKQLNQVDKCLISLYTIKLFCLVI